MKLKFKHQKFQADAAKAVVDVFKGQPCVSDTYKIDPGQSEDLNLFQLDGWNNNEIILSDNDILKNINKIQRENGIKPSDKLEGKYNLTIEMETGTGKTYTYIKTMYELNKHYGWSKFIVVVPSIAIREGVKKSFEITQEHFAEEYYKKIRFFVYDSKRLTEIDRFAADSNINVMIINSQAFNAKGKDARRIRMRLDEFRSRKPIDVIAKTRPILVIDEPQSVEGKKTKEGLKDFKPLFTLRYSATHRDKYNMIYRLDAMDAYNKKLVKKIQVKGITQNGNTAADGYLYLESINISKSAPTATIQFDNKSKTGIRKKVKRVEEGDNIYVLSGEMEEYKHGYTVSCINGKDDSIEFLNGIKLYPGDVVGNINEDAIRRIQIRETILSHIETERQLYFKGIKVLSLFFIDEVAKYKQYDESGSPYNGIYADIFEEEYNNIVHSIQGKFGEENYFKEYLDKINADKTHAGYFSIDNKGKIRDSKLKGRKGEKYCDDIDAYELIMKNKELLLESDPHKSPVRFIFSHSALKEGWDNPNVFQICTLKQSSSEVRKRQEVGRGLRLCVNNVGERQDESVLGEDVQNINLLTVIASESYESFAKDLQREIADTLYSRPTKVNTELFENKSISDNDGNTIIIDEALATKINYELIRNGYVDSEAKLTEKYYEYKKKNSLSLSDDLNYIQHSIFEVVDSIYDEKAFKPENGRTNPISLEVEQDKFNSKEFQTLWKKINKKSYYTVQFDTKELIEKSIHKLDAKLNVPKIIFNIKEGIMNKISSQETLIEGAGFIATNDRNIDSKAIKSNVTYDLVGSIAKKTNLTRRAIVSILQGISPKTFSQFRYNPEEFILKASNLINEEKATAIVQHISYDLLNDEYDTTIFTEPSLKGKLDVNARKSKKHLYDHLIYDSKNEKEFSEELDISNDVEVYVKLPSGFYISTPVGKYNPDWAIAFKEGSVKHVYFVAETKGSMSDMELREIEKTKISCAKKHFKAISGEDVKYHVVDNYSTLMDLVK